MKFSISTTQLFFALSSVMAIPFNDKFVDGKFFYGHGREETYSGTITVTNLAPEDGTCQTVSSCR